jgi:hypothetical protein
MGRCGACPLTTNQRLGPAVDSCKRSAGGWPTDFGCFKRNRDCPVSGVDGTAISRAQGSGERAGGPVVVLHAQHGVVESADKICGAAVGEKRAPHAARGRSR